MTRKNPQQDPQRPEQTPTLRPGIKAILNPDPKATRIAILLQDLAAANQRVETLRAKLPTSVRGSQTVERAISDAYKILVEAFNTGQTGRDYMLAKVGMKRSAWQWGVAFLRCAGIIAQRKPNQPQDWQTGLQFVVRDRDEAFARHRQASLEIEVKEDGYQFLRRMWIYGFLPHESVDVNSKSFVQAKSGENTNGASGNTASVTGSGVSGASVQGNGKGKAVVYSPGGVMGNTGDGERDKQGQQNGQRVRQRRG